MVKSLITEMKGWKETLSFVPFSNKDISHPWSSERNRRCHVQLGVNHHEFGRLFSFTGNASEKIRKGLFGQSSGFAELELNDRLPLLLFSFFLLRLN